MQQQRHKRRQEQQLQEKAFLALVANAKTLAAFNYFTLLALPDFILQISFGGKNIKNERDEFALGCISRGVVALTGVRTAHNAGSVIYIFIFIFICDCICVHICSYSCICRAAASRIYELLLLFQFLERNCSSSSSNENGTAPQQTRTKKRKMDFKNS